MRIVGRSIPAAVLYAMSEIWIPESLRGDVGRANLWDAYHIDLKLKDGRVFKNLVAREGVWSQEIDTASPPNNPQPQSSASLPNRLEMRTSGQYLVN